MSEYLTFTNGIYGVFAAIATYIFYETVLRKPPKNAPPVYTAGIPILGTFFAFAKDPIRTIRHAYDTKGDCFTMKFFHKNVTFMNGNDCLDSFFKARDEELDQASVYKFMTPIFGKDVVYDAPLKKRRQQYKFLGASLRPDMLRNYPERICQETQDFFKKHWSEFKGTKNLRDEMAQLTILTASNTLLGRDVRENLFEQVAEKYHTLDEGLTPFSIFFPYFPIAAHRNRDRARVEMTEIFGKAIRKRQQALENAPPSVTTTPKGKKKAKDMLETLMDAKFKDGSKLTVDQITGLLIAALFAGQHTSNITMTWTTLFLLQDRDNGGTLLEEVREEIDRVQTEFQNRGEDPFAWKALEEMELLHSCIKEAIRLFPPLIMLMREVKKQLNLKSGIVVPEGHIVMVSQAMAMRLPSLFDNPDEFRPKRWMEGGKAKENERKVKYAFFGFGAGTHTCMGQQFAYMQVKTVLIHLLTKFELEMIGSFPEPDYGAIVVGPKGDTKIRYRRRNVTYTTEEVAKHNKEDDCWLIVNNKVYDVSEFLKEHHGGADAILRHGGKEATKAVLENEPHPEHIEVILERFYIGSIAK